MELGGKIKKHLAFYFFIRQIFHNEYYCKFRLCNKTKVLAYNRHSNICLVKIITICSSSSSIYWVLTFRALHVFSHYPYNKSSEVSSYHCFIEWGNWGSEKLSTLFKVTRLSGTAGIWVLIAFDFKASVSNFFLLLSKWGLTEY